jgi:uncharacterized protein YcaQ
MDPIVLTKPQARAFLLRKHGLSGPPRFHGADGVCAFVRQAGCVQFDPIDVCGRNAELVFQSRVPDFTKGMLDRLLYEDRRLVDAFDKNLSLCGVEDWPAFARFRKRYGHHGRNADRIGPVEALVLDRAEELPFVAARDIPVKETVDWGWGPTSLARAALETLYFRGDLVIHHKKGPIKFYAPAARHLPAELLLAPDPHPDDDDFGQWMALRRIGSVGLLWNRPSDAWLMMHGFKGLRRDAAFAALLAAGRILPVRVEGIADPLYARAEDEPLLREAAEDGTAGDDAPAAAPRLELLAPLDNLLWDRRLVRALFGFDYTWEIYAPAARRKYGYYVLPVLYGHRLVGRIEPVVDRKAGRLVVKGFWPEPGLEADAAFEAALRERLERFAAFHGCTVGNALPSLVV